MRHLQHAAIVHPLWHYSHSVYPYPVAVPLSYVRRKMIWPCTNYTPILCVHCIVLTANVSSHVRWKHLDANPQWDCYSKTCKSTNTAAPKLTPMYGFFSQPTACIMWSVETHLMPYFPDWTVYAKGLPKVLVWNWFRNVGDRKGTENIYKGTVITGKINRSGKSGSCLYLATL